MLNQKKVNTYINFCLKPYSNMLQFRTFGAHFEAMTQGQSVVALVYQFEVGTTSKPLFSVYWKSMWHLLDRRVRVRILKQAQMTSYMLGFCKGNFYCL